MPESMYLQVNDERLPWCDGEHLDALLVRLGAEPSRVATALNGQFVARAARAATALRPGDVVTVFQAIVGG